MRCQVSDLLCYAMLCYAMRCQVSALPPPSGAARGAADRGDVRVSPAHVTFSRSPLLDPAPGPAEAATAAKLSSPWVDTPLPAAGAPAATERERPAAGVAVMASEMEAGEAARGEEAVPRSEP